jgi:ribosomal protein S18 acetylase RimI-like enzyme
MTENTSSNSVPQIILLKAQHLPDLYSFWQNLGKDIPFFFRVSPETWQECFLEDRLDGRLIFKTLHTWLAFGRDELLGFVQFGQPNFAWDSAGNPYSDPVIGVIRHLYFKQDAPEAGQALLAKAESFLEQFRVQHAFYHIFGMSCNAHHGKLHESLAHVERLLLESGFQVEHENVYYALDLEQISSARQIRDRIEVIRAVRSPGVEAYEFLLEGSTAGTAEVRLLTIKEDAPKTAYLTWIGVREGQKGQGLGSRFLHAVIEDLRARKYRWLHTDTASTNAAAQHFYERFGFSNLGKTRSYLRTR